MIIVRVMTPEGESKFREYITALKGDLSAARPDLNIEPYSKEFSPVVEIDNEIHFDSKMELAEYVNKEFRRVGIRRETIINESGLWTWLAYLWFDLLTCFDPSTGSRRIREVAKYICSSDYRDYYRHLVAGPYSIYSLYGPDLSRIFLYSPVDEHNDFIEQIASRQFLISHQNLIEVLFSLYWDESRRKPKSGAQSRNKPGTLRRFVRVIQQLELTYDIYSLSKNEIIRLLPDEFNKWEAR